MTDKCFASVSAALHLAYLLEYEPVSPHTPMTKLYLKSMPKSSSRLTGMTPLEVRGQLAMIRAAVKHHLHPAEAAAVEARYGQLQTQALAIKYLIEYLQPQFKCDDADYLMEVVAAVLTDLPKRQLSLRKIAKERGKHAESVRRLSLSFLKHHNELYKRAYGNLQVVLSRIVDND